MKTGRVCVTHNGCMQLMTRGDDADITVRAMLKLDPARVPKLEPAPEPAREPAAEPERKRAGWGVLSW